MIPFEAKLQLQHLGILWPHLLLHQSSIRETDHKNHFNVTVKSKNQVPLGRLYSHKRAMLLCGYQCPAL